MRDALIGYSGFVGGNIAKNHSFAELYNSKNIAEIEGKEFDLLVSCGTPSLFWKANLEPKSDWKNIKELIKHLKTIKVNHFILISTIFVYPEPYGVSEESEINTAKLTPYGLHRYKLEQFVKTHFEKHTIIRLPNLFGLGIKKNFIYDLIHNNRLDLTHKNSLMQWYDLENIWKDIQIAIKNNLKIVNFAVEPLEAKKIAKICLGLDFQTITEKPALNHNMLTKHAGIYGSKKNYLYDKKTTLEKLRKFIRSQQ